MTYDGHVITVESKTGRGIGNHYQLLIDGQAQDVATTFCGDYQLLIDSQEIDMGKDFVA